MVDGAIALTVVHHELERRGNPSILLFQPSVDAQRDESSVATWLTEWVQFMLSEENDFRDQYAAYAAAGAFVVAVPVSDPDELAGLVEALKPLGVHHLRYFGSAAVIAV